MERIEDMVRALGPRLVEWRRDFHRYPESAWTEYGTTARIAEQLERLGYTLSLGQAIHDSQSRVALPTSEASESAYRRALAEGAPSALLEQMQGGYTGVVGTLRCGKGPTVAVRVDMDALEVAESQAEDHRPFREGFASRHPGLCHSCGHDGHIAMGLGVAQLVSACRQQLGGTFKIIFQPGEEGMRGARSMTAKGVVDDVDYFFGGHIGIRALATGEIVTGCRDFLSTSKLDAEFFGEAAHAGLCPHKGKSAIMAAATACLQLQAIPRHGEGASRINVGFISGGSGSRNVVPDYCVIRLETRGATAAINDYMEQSARNIILCAAQLQGVTARITDMGSAVGADSDGELMAVVRSAAEETPGVTGITDSAGFDACEDVTYMMNRVRQRGGKATYLMIGSRLAAGHHAPEFDFDEESLAIGTQVLARSVLSLLGRGAL